LYGYYYLEKNTNIYIYIQFIFNINKLNKLKENKKLNNKKIWNNNTEFLRNNNRIELEKENNKCFEEHYDILEKETKLNNREKYTNAWLKWIHRNEYHHLFTCIIFILKNNKEKEGNNEIVYY